MIKYTILDNVLDIEEEYNNLLNSDNNLVIIRNKNDISVLTKEKSLFNITSIEDFLEEEKENVFYKTVIDNDVEVNERDLKIYYDYLDKYKDKMMQHYGDYLFGSVAVKSDNGFITTIRGKKDFKDYAVVKNVNHEKHLVYANKKATLNAPLLDNLFKNDKVKVIVHINHLYDETLPYQEYALPGSTKDSLRINKTSFNIKYHGVIYLFDKEGRLIKDE